MPVPSASPQASSQLGAFAMEVRLLGPFEVLLDGHPLHIGSPKQRAVLSLLALQATRVVSAESLCDLIWDEDQPASPAATLQSLISRLRAALGRDVLRTREPGWVLDVEPTAVDALRFQELTARARRHTARGDAAATVTDLADALGLWRGAALLDVVDAGYLAGHATRLNEARLDAIEELAKAELATGGAGDALARLEDHVDANPLRERSWGLLMVALYRVGRQTDALRAFQQLRGILHEQLGIDPSPELVQIEQQILRHDPALAGPRPEPPLTSPPVGSVQFPTSGRGLDSRHVGPRGEFTDYSVVVVEDHDFQRRTVVQLLRGLGVGTVTDEANGVDALQLLQGAPVPDIIICDIDMPGMDGVEFVTRVAERNLACSIVIVSGLESNVLRAVESIGESHGLHILAALPKPLTARRLGEVLRQYTRLNRGGADSAERVAVSSEELRHALEVGDLRARFEPRIDLSTGAFSSAEASGRWHRPGAEPMPASVFLPALTQGGFLLPFVERLLVDSSVLLDELARAELGVNAPVRVALDVSALLADDSVADRLSQMVQQRGQDPHRFVCQLDESALARAPSTALAVLTRLRVKGFGLSMSHCGIGPSWTHQLERVPLTEVKLERALVSAATSEPKRFQMLERAVSSARERGLPVVADGCDSPADLDMLLALGCSQAQGPCVAQPMDATGVVAWALAGYQLAEPGATR